jgi:endoglucanase
MASANGRRPSSRNALARALVLAVVITGVHLRASATPAFGAEDEAQHHNELLGRGINLGNALEAPREGAWGVTLKAQYFQDIKDAGFNSVRIPINWAAHAGTQPPYTIQPMFFSRVDWAIEQALSRDLVAVINVHHYDEMNRNPDEHLPRLLAIWRQIAQHYRGYADRLYFELLNEPSNQLTDERWQAMVPELLRVVRESNPTRMLIVGPAYWNGLNHLDKLRLPDNDRRLIATFHYYAPFRFTHQAAGWVPGSDAWKGTAWEGSAPEQEALARDFDEAAAWAARNKRPLYVGEFGAYHEADMASRARWTKSVVEAARKRGFSWAYWEFCSGFGAYDPLALKWRAPLLESLMGNRNGGKG